MYQIFHGDDEFSRSEELAKLRSGMGDPQFADLNSVVFDGRKVTLSEMAHACDAVPFLADKRLVIVEGMLARFEPRRPKGNEASGEAGREETEEEVNPDLAKNLKEYLSRLPSSTELVFVESKTLAKNNPILKQAQAETATARVREFQPPDAGEIQPWIQQRAAAKGTKIEPDAARELANHIGADLRLLDGEIEKLSAYCGKSAIRQEDVRLLVASVRESSIFDLVDAIGARQTNAAMRLLHEHLNQNAAPLYLLAMIIRQFRLLLQIKDLMTRGQNQAAARAQLKLHPYVLDKTWRQAANFTLAELEATYRKLLDADLAMKTSRGEPVVVLDMLVVELTRR